MLVQRWVSKGMPKGTQVLGSFESWSEVIGGILDCAGIPGFLGVVDDPVSKAGDDWQILFEFWLRTFGGSDVTVARVFDAASQQEDLRIPGKGETDKAHRQSFGGLLRRKKETVYSIDGLSVELVPGDAARGGANTWCLRSTTGEPIPSTQPSRKADGDSGDSGDSSVSSGSSEGGNGNGSRGSETTSTVTTVTHPTFDSLLEGGLT